MHKFLFIFIAFNVCGISIANADQSFGSGDSNRCHYITNTGKKSTGDNWTYYWCGPATKKCGGKTDTNHDKTVLHYNGDSFSWNGNKYWCCGGTRTDIGRYIPGKWIKKQDEETIKLETGTCTKKTITTICGDTIVEDCDEPEDCNPGFKKRNGECVKPCGEGEVFESPTSNTCIECPTTAYQGIATVIKEKKRLFETVKIPYEVCIKCDKDSEFYDKVEKKCVSQSGFQRISNTAMKACWKCPGAYMKDCVIAMEPSQDNTNKPSNWTEIKKECDLE